MLLEWLAARQGSLTDGRFAREVLKVEKGTYSSYKTGRRRVSAEFAIKCQAAFPESCTEIRQMYEADRDSA